MFITRLWAISGDRNLKIGEQGASYQAKMNIRLYELWMVLFLIIVWKKGFFSNSISFNCCFGSTTWPILPDFVKKFSNQYHLYT